MAENEELQLKQPKGKPHKAEDVKFVFTNIFTAIKAELLAGIFPMNCSSPARAEGANNPVRKTIARIVLSVFLTKAVSESRFHSQMRQRILREDKRQVSQACKMAVRIMEIKACRL
jgi:hypothetical protein